MSVRAPVALARAHRPLLVLLAVGAALRALAMLAYPPALFFDDSWGYVFTAFTGHPVALSYLRPNGYPLLIRLLTLPDRELVQLVALQHLSGLVSGALVYAALVRAGVRRLLATAAAALVLLDGYTITLDQHLMPEPFFTLTLLGAALLLAWPRLRRPAAEVSSRAMALAGLLLAAGAIQREAGLLVVPVFVIYVLWSRVDVRPLAAFAVALAVPVLTYAALVDAKLGGFELSEMTGWTLYGRVAAFADCDRAGIHGEARRLCETPALRRMHPTAGTWYIWNSDSPAARLFPGGGHQTRRAQAHSNAVLGAFARRIIVHQPLDYASAVARDVLRYFTPGAKQFNDAYSATYLPRNAAAEAHNERVRRRVLPSVHPSVRSPARLLRAYRSIIHVPRPVLALLALGSLATLLLRLPARREILLLAGSGLALIIGAAATAGFGMRYLLPAVPLLAIGGTLALRDLWDSYRAARARRQPGPRS